MGGCDQRSDVESDRAHQFEGVALLDDAVAKGIVELHDAVFEVILEVNVGREDRVENDRDVGVGRESEGRIADRVVGSEHPDLDRRRPDRVDRHAQHFEQRGREDRQDPFHLQTVLNGQCRRHRRPMDAEGVKDLQVGLEACAPGRVGASDGQCAQHSEGMVSSRPCARILMREEQRICRDRPGDRYGSEPVPLRGRGRGLPQIAHV